MTGIIDWLLTAPPPCPPWLVGATRLQLIIVCASALAALLGAAYVFAHLVADALTDTTPEPKRYKPPTRLRRRGLFRQL